MRTLERITGKENILNLLVMFDDVFPNLKNRVSDLKDYAKKLDANANVYAGKEIEDVFGMLVFYCNDLNGKTAYISLIGIKKEYEHKGLGRYLLKNCVEFCKKADMKRLRLEVDLDNINAIHFYEKNGMVETDHTDRNSMYMEMDI